MEKTRLSKTLKTEKLSREKKCFDRFGESYEYDPSFDWDSCRSLADCRKKFADKAVFNYKDCQVQKKPTDSKDKRGLVFPDANTRWKCSTLRGRWAPDSLVKGKAWTTGVCYTSNEGRRCSAYQFPDLMKYTSKKGPKPQEGARYAQKKKCIEARCGFRPNGECSDPALLKAFQTKLENAAVRVLQRKFKRGQLKKKVKELARRAKLERIKEKVVGRRVRNKLRRAKKVRHFREAFYKGKVTEALKRKLKAKRNQAKADRFKEAFYKGKVAEAFKRKLKAKRNQAKADKFKNVFYRGKVAKALERKALAMREKKLHLEKKYAVMVRNRLYRGRLPGDFPKDMRSEGFQKRFAYYMRGEDTIKPKPFNEHKVDGNQCSTSKNNTLKKKALPSKLNVNQSVVYAMAQTLKDGDNRGFLSWSSTGSGKTVAAACVMDVFWNTKKPIFFVSSKEGLRSNDESKFTGFMSTIFKKLKAKKTREGKVDTSEFRKRVKSMSFITLANHLGLMSKKSKHADKNMLNDAVLIIDEVQNLMKPPIEAFKAHHKALERFLRYNQSNTKNLKVVILTATPGATPEEVVTLLNLVRDRRDVHEITVPDTSDPESVNKFRNKIRGLVQYFDTNNDPSKFPSLNYETPYLLPMSKTQFQVYAEAYVKEQKRSTNVTKDTYFALARKYATMMFDRKKNMELAEFSSKLPKVMELLEQYPREKHWMYSAFYQKTRGYGTGISGVAKLLQEQGYSQVTPQEATGMLHLAHAGRADEIPRKDRYCVLANTEMKNPDKDVAKLVELYNLPQNLNGSICKVMLASQRYNEGVDLAGVRHIHILEPLLTEAMMQQAVGRARRHCSHMQFADQKDWVVKVHQYLGVKPLNLKIINKNRITSDLVNVDRQLVNVVHQKEQVKGKRNANSKRIRDEAETAKKALTERKKELKALVKEAGKANTKAAENIDEIIMERAKAKGKEMEELFKAMRNASVDCVFFEKFHKDSMGIPDIKCMDS
jgi:superfamily II DNA or RNA helicase